MFEITTGKWSRYEICFISLQVDEVDMRYVDIFTTGKWNIYEICLISLHRFQIWLISLEVNGSDINYV